MNGNKLPDEFEKYPLPKFTRLDYGGGAWGNDISKEMIKKGFRPIIISGGGELESEIKDSGIEHIKLNIGEKNLSTLLLVKELSQIFITKRVDIIHARSRLPAWISSFALRMIKTANKISWLTTVHGPYTVNYYSKIMVSGDKSLYLISQKIYT